MSYDTTILAEFAVIVDLDDTLYAERDYQASGFNCLLDLVTTLYPLEKSLALNVIAKGGDVVGGLAALTGGELAHESLLWKYRVHSPQISLDQDAVLFLGEVLANAYAFAIVTDGRSITQRLKLEALGLGEASVYISDEYGGKPKPDQSRFIAIQDRFRAPNYVYVGNDVHKDFAGPRELGWLTIGVNKYNGEIAVKGKVEGVQPDYWAENLSDVLDLICQ